MTIHEILKRMHASPVVLEWAAQHPDLDAIWTNCQYSDWMLWLLDRTTLDKDDKRLRLMACDFAETVLHLIPPGEDRPRRAIEVARRYANGDATKEELHTAGEAARAAWDAAYAAGNTAWDAAMDAAGGTARAASYAAGDAACAASYAAVDAAYAASYAAWYAASYAAWYAAGAAQCQIIRKYFPTCPEINPEYLTSKEK